MEEVLYQRSNLQFLTFFDHDLLSTAIPTAMVKILVSNFDAGLAQC